MMRIFTTLIAALAAVTLSACGSTGPFTEGQYRLPYANGVEVRITQDDLTHGSPAKNMFDFAGARPEQVLVAAAPGWVRFFEEGNDVGGSSNNNYIWIEHPLDYCQPPAPGTVGSTAPTTCKTCAKGLGKCNEWTLTVHMRTNSITAPPPLGAGLSLNQWVEAGQPIAIEGAVGHVFKSDGTRCSDADFANDRLCARHAHFNVFTFDRDWVDDETDPPTVPTVNGDYEAYVNTLDERPERVPVFCTAEGLRIVRQGETHRAAPCPPVR